MPEFEQNDLTPYRTLNVHFRNEEDISAFAELLGQSITDRTKSMWYPILERNNYQEDEYTDEDAAVASGDYPS